MPPQASDNSIGQIIIKIFVICLMILLLPGLFCVLASLPDTLKNNRQLAAFEKNFYGYPLPSETDVIDQQSRITLLGNSNHCDFVVEQTLESRLSLQEIEAYYRDVIFPAARSETQTWEDSFTSGIHPPVRVRVELLGTQEDTTIVKVSLVDAGYPPGLDIRCH